MDGADHQQVRARNRTIGVVGRANLTEDERTALVEVGAIIAKLNRTVATVPALGTAQAVREGVELEGGTLLDLESDVIGQADHTFVFADKALLTRLQARYPSLATLPNVTIVDTATEWLEAMRVVAEEHGITG